MIDDDDDDDDDDAFRGNTTHRKCILLIHNWADDMIVSSIADANKVQCQYCDKWIHKRTIQRHVRHQHQESAQLVSCEYCNVTYKNDASLNNHLRIKHGIYKQ